MFVSSGDSISPRVIVRPTYPAFSEGDAFTRLLAVCFFVTRSGFGVVKIFLKSHGALMARSERRKGGSKNPFLLEILLLLTRIRRRHRRA